MRIVILLLPLTFDSVTINYCNFMNNNQYKDHSAAIYYSGIVDYSTTYLYY